jgi:acetyl esterase/lipase
MPIDPWLADRFVPIRDIPSLDAALRDPRYAPAFMRYLQDPAPWTPPEGVTVEGAAADGPHGPVPLRVFRPAADPASALLWMHGGGFVMGTVDDTESVIPGYELASRSGALVVSAGYRLAVDGVRYPAPLDDVLAAWDWLAEHEPGARRFVGGASAGGNLAAGAAVRLRERGGDVPTGMLLAYPFLHFPMPPTGSALMRELEQLPPMLRFEPDYQLGIMHNYLGRITDPPPEAAPGNHSLAGLPATWIAPAEFDELRASGELFTRQLAESGIPAHLHIAEGMVHGYLGRAPSLPAVDAVLEFFAEALRA